MKSKPPQTLSPFVTNIASSILSLVGPLLFAFIATPFLVRGLGTEAYGYYSLVLAVIGFGFTTGIGRVTAKYIPEIRAANKADDLAPLLTATLLITLSAALLQSILLALATPILVSSIFNVPDIDAPELRKAIYFACLVGPIMMLSQVFQAALQGIHRFRVYASLSISASFLLNLGSIILAINDFSFSKIFIWNLIVAASAGIGFFLFARRRIPEMAFELDFDRKAIRKVARFAASIFVYQSITSIFYLFERAYILRNFGAETLAYYTIPLMLGVYLHGIVLSFSHVVVPNLNEKIKIPMELSDTYRTVTKVSVSASAFMMLMYFCVGAELLTLWLGPDFAARSYKVLLVQGLAFGTLSISIVCWILSEAAHRPGINAMSSITTSLIGISSIFFLASTYQAEGVAGGRLIGAAAVLPLIFIVEGIVFGSVMWRFWAELVGRILAACAPVLALHFLVFTQFEFSLGAFLFTTGSLTVTFWTVLLLSRYISKTEITLAFVAPPAGARNTETMGGVQ